MTRGGCPEPRPECPYSERPEGCFSDLHHLYFPRLDYRDIMSAEFRELPENKQQICRWEHEQRHASEQPLEKPTREEMLGRIATALESGNIHLSKNKLRKLGFIARNET